MVGLGAARAEASDWRSPAGYRRTDRQTAGQTAGSGRGLTSRRREKRGEICSCRSGTSRRYRLQGKASQKESVPGRDREESLGFGLLFLVLDG